MSKIYVLQHKDENFTGQFGHVGFENGRGSTSSKQDADWCCSVSKHNANPPCKLFRTFIPKAPEEIEKDKMKKVRAAKKPKAKKKTSKKETKEKEKPELIRKVKNEGRNPD